MIKINLMPEDLRERESSFKNIKMNFKLQGRVFRNIAIAAILVLAILHLSLFFIAARNSSIFNSMSQSYKKLLPNKKEYEALKAEVGVTNKKAKAIEVLMANRFSWAKKLNELSDSVTQGIWLTALTYEEKQNDVSVQVAPPPSPSGAVIRERRLPKRIRYTSGI